MTDLPIPLDDHEEMELPAGASHTQRNRWWLIGGLIAVCLAIGIRRYIIANGTPSTFFAQPGSTQSQSPTPTPTPAPEPGLTVLLMGRGGAGHDGGALADTIVLARILETQKRIILLSLPRDLWVNIPYKGTDGVMGKINGSYAIGVDTRNYTDKAEQYTGPYGGGTLAKDVVSTVTGLPIDKYITVDFSGFEQAVDTLGGIDVSVDRAFTDYEYPISGRESLDCTTYQSQASPSGVLSEADLISQGKLDVNTLPELPKQYPCRYELLQFKTGKQRMDGKTALKYVRSRHSAEDGNDFSRSRRQKLALQAVSDKLFSIGAVTKIPSFFTTLRSHIDTDLSTADIVGLLPKAQEYRGYTITSLTLSTDNYLGQGYTKDLQFQLFPLTGVANYDPIKQWISRTINSAEKNKYPVIEIQGNWKNASASASLKETLIQAGFPTRAGQLVMQNATTSATLILHSESIDTETLKKVKEIAQVQDSFTVVKSASGSAVTSDIKILLP